MFEILFLHSIYLYNMLAWFYVIVCGVYIDNAHSKIENYRNLVIFVRMCGVLCTTMINALMMDAKTLCFVCRTVSRLPITESGM